MTTDTVCDGIVGKYLGFLSGDFEITPLRSGHSGCYVITPFARPDGEAIELELTLLPNSQIRLSDMGDTLAYLYVNGLTLTRSVRDKIRRIARRYRLNLRQNALVIESENAIEGEAVHRLMQATLEATALIQSRSRRSTGRVKFDTEVESFIIQSGVVYDVDHKVTGQREAHTFKFHVNSGRNLLVQPITATTESVAHSWAERWAYRFADTLARTSYVRPMAVLDDRGGLQSVWTGHAQAPIGETAILWGDKESLTKMLAL